MRSLRWVWPAVWVALVLPGCPRMVGEDGGPPADANYDPVEGNPFEGPLSLDDERVRALDPNLLRAGSSPCRAPILGRVHRVIDGDTVNVRGESEVFDANVRIIGVDTPEVAHDGMPEECFGDEARAFNDQLLDRLVWLTFDRECFDRFDRVLAYLHVGGGNGDLWERQLL
ncbi:MAG: thermonuclease family protein, partial [Gemmatimonadota bacterium]|nr:thermonuclease family protein [Gemmatimonadota bacterium]